MYTVCTLCILEIPIACAKMQLNTYFISWLHHRDRKKVLFILSTFLDDIQIAIKAGKSDQFYEQLNGVCAKIINFMVEVEQGYAITFLHIRS